MSTIRDCLVAAKRRAAITNKNELDTTEAIVRDIVWSFFYWGVTIGILLGIGMLVIAIALLI